MKTVLYTDVLYRAAELAGRPRDKLPVSEAVMLQNSIAVDLEEAWNRVIWPELNPDPLNVTVSGQKFSKNEGVTGTTLSNNAAQAVNFILDGRPGGLLPVAVPVNAASTGTFGTSTGTIVRAQTGGGATVSANIPDGVIFSGTITWDGTSITFIPTIEMGDILTVLTANPLITTRYRAVGFMEGDNSVWIDENLASVWVDFVLPMTDLMSLSGSGLNAYKIPQRFRNYLSLRAAAQLLAMDGQTASASGFLATAETALARQLDRLPPPPDWRQVRVRSGYGRYARGGGTTQIAN